MPQAITIGTFSAVSTAYGGGAPSPASLQAQLQRYPKQLSDCVNCASANTPQGKADIQAISTRINQIEQRIAQTKTTRTNPSATIQRPPAPAASTTSGYGSLINVLA